MLTVILILTTLICAFRVPASCSPSLDHEDTFSRPTQFSLPKENDDHSWPDTTDSEPDDHSTDPISTEVQLETLVRKHWDEVRETTHQRQRRAIGDIMKSIGFKATLCEFYKALEAVAAEFQLCIPEKRTLRRLWVFAKNPQLMKETCLQPHRCHYCGVRRMPSGFDWKAIMKSVYTVIDAAEDWLLDDKVAFVRAECDRLGISGFPSEEQIRTRFRRARKKMKGRHEAPRDSLGDSGTRDQRAFLTQCLASDPSLSLCAIRSHLAAYSNSLGEASVSECTLRSWYSKQLLDLPGDTMPPDMFCHLESCSHCGPMKQVRCKQFTSLILDLLKRHRKSAYSIDMYSELIAEIHRHGYQVPQRQVLTRAIKVANQTLKLNISSTK